MFSCSSVAAWSRGKLFRLNILIISLAVLSMASAAEPPAIPVGLDAYRHWERWPYQRIGARAYMRSTYDRRGGNEGADASHFLHQLADDFNVTLDVEGSGQLSTTHEPGATKAARRQQFDDITRSLRGKSDAGMQEA